MKLLIALLLLVCTCSFIKWHAPVSEGWRNLRRTTPLSLFEDDGPERNDSPDKKKFNFFRLPPILEKLAEQEVDVELVRALDQVLLEGGLQMGFSRLVLETFKEGDFLRLFMNIPKGSKITHGRLGHYLGELSLYAMRKFLRNPILNDSVENVKDRMKDKIKEIQISSFPDPSPRVKSSTPLEYFLSHSNGGNIGNFFFELFSNQWNHDAVASLVEGRQSVTISLLSSSEPNVEAGIGVLELRIAELVRERFKEAPVEWNNDMVIAVYLKYRVIPTWFVDYRQELSEMVGLNSTETQQS